LRRSSSSSRSLAFFSFLRFFCLRLPSEEEEEDEDEEDEEDEDEEDEEDEDEDSLDDEDSLRLRLPILIIINKREEDDDGDDDDDDWVVPHVLLSPFVLLPPRDVQYFYVSRRDFLKQLLSQGIAASMFVWLRMNA